jgi:hypothetical protein
VITASIKGKLITIYGTHHDYLALAKRAAARNKITVNGRTQGE